MTISQALYPVKTWHGFGMAWAEFPISLCKGSENPNLMVQILHSQTHSGQQSSFIFWIPWNTGSLVHLSKASRHEYLVWTIVHWHTLNVLLHNMVNSHNHFEWNQFSSHVSCHGHCTALHFDLSKTHSENRSVFGFSVWPAFPNLLIERGRRHQGVSPFYYRKTPWSSWENQWFPVKIFP